MWLLMKDFQKLTWLGGRGLIEILIGVTTGGGVSIVNQSWSSQN